MNTVRSASTAIILAFSLLPMAALADGGIYVGASIGSANLDDDFDGLTINTDSTSFRILGGWRFNENFSIEAGYHDFGDFEQQIDIGGSLVTVGLSADGYTLGVAGALPVTDRISLIGRLGMFFWDGAAEINNVSQATPEDSNLYFSGGASYALTERFSLVGDWSRYDLDDTQSNVISAGFRYQFGK